MCMEEEERERERERERGVERGGGVERERYTSDPLLVASHGPSGHHTVK